MFQRFRDRSDAGRRLAMHVLGYGSAPDVVVLGLPRGGVPVAYEVARALRAPLDVFTVRKLGVPGHEELAMGAIAPGGAMVLNEEIVEALMIEPDVILEVATAQGRELARREASYRGDAPALPLTGRTVLLVDDGLATGASMRAAVTAVREVGPRAVVVAVPVGARETCDSLRELADDVICAESPSPFHAVGLWYEDFSQTSDEEVRQLLRAGRTLVKPQAPAHTAYAREGRG